MTWTTLISAEELGVAIDRCVVIDCRHDLLNPQAGSTAWAAGHIPGARFLHQDNDLAGARELIDWLTSPQGQARIASFKVGGETLFFPGVPKPAR